MSTPWAAEKERQASQGGWAVWDPAQWRPSRPWSHPPGLGPDEQATTCEFSKVIHFFCSKNPNFKILTMLKEEFPRNILDWTISNHGLPWWLSGKESACNAEDPGSVSAGEDPLEKGMVTYFSILAWRIPRPEERGGLYSPWGQRLRHDVATKPPHKQPAIL